MSVRPAWLVACLYFSIFPLAPVFALPSNITWPLVISAVFLPVLYMQRKYLPVSHIDRSFLLLSVSAVAAIFTSFLVNVALGVEVNIKHFVGIVTMYVFYICVPIKMVDVVGSFKVFQLVRYTFWVLFFFGILDFLSYNFLSVSLGDMLLKFRDEYPTGYGHLAGLKRNKSIFQEPGFYAWYLNTVGLLLIGASLSVGRITQAKKLSLIYGLALFTTFSATGFLVVCSLLLCVLVLQLKKPLYFLLLGVSVLALGVVSYDLIAPVMESKVFGGSVSRADRFSRWEDALSLFRDNMMFGAGLGMYSIREGGGLASFPLKVLAEAGVISFFFFVSFWLYTAYNIFKSRVLGIAKAFFYISLFGALIHWFTSTPFYFAFSWTYFVLINLFLRRGLVFA